MALDHLRAFDGAPGVRVEWNQVASEFESTGALVASLRIVTLADIRLRLREAHYFGPYSPRRPLTSRRWA